MARTPRSRSSPLTLPNCSTTRPASTIARFAASTWSRSSASHTRSLLYVGGALDPSVVSGELEGAAALRQLDLFRVRSERVPGGAVELDAFQAIAVGDTEA